MSREVSKMGEGESVGAGTEMGRAEGEAVCRRVWTRRRRDWVAAGEWARAMITARLGRGEVVS